MKPEIPTAQAIQDALTVLHSAIANPRQGLPQEVFYFISQLTPMVNVDLLIKNDKQQTLLTWRADAFYGPGWHIPGGIIRFKESSGQRIQAVAQRELGVAVSFDTEPLCIKEVMNPTRDVRGHFISLLYRCELLGEPNPTLAWHADHPAENGQWAWHDHFPDNMIRVHEMYRPYLAPATPLAPTPINLP